MMYQVYKIVLNKYECNINEEKKEMNIFLAFIWFAFIYSTFQPWKRVPNWVANAVHNGKIIESGVFINVMDIPFIKGIDANAIGWAWVV